MQFAQHTLYLKRLYNKLRNSMFLFFCQIRKHFSLVPHEHIHIRPGGDSSCLHPCNSNTPPSSVPSCVCECWAGAVPIALHYFLLEFQFCCIIDWAKIGLLSESPLENQFLICFHLLYFFYRHFSILFLFKF